VPHPSFFEGWDSMIVSRVGFLADSCSALVHRVHRRSPSPTLFAKYAKRMGHPAYVLTQPGCTIHAHAPCSTSGRTSQHNTRNTPSDARRFRGGIWSSEPDANAHIRRQCSPQPCRLCSPCLGSSCIAPVTDMSHAGALEKRSPSMRPTIASRVLSCQ
jgi:hypothetical protein